MDAEEIVLRLAALVDYPRDTEIGFCHCCDDLCRLEAMPSGWDWERHHPHCPWYNAQLWALARRDAERHKESEETNGR